jgi:hypothetical protein
MFLSHLMGGQLRYKKDEAAGRRQRRTQTYLPLVPRHLLLLLHFKWPLEVV